MNPAVIDQSTELNAIAKKLTKKRFRATQLSDGELQTVESFIHANYEEFLKWLGRIKAVRDAKRKKVELLHPLTSIAGSDVPPITPERKAAIEQLCLTNYKAITAACLADERLTQDDASLIFGDLERASDRYTGELNTDAFQQWALEAIKPLVAFYRMRREHWRAVYKGAWSIVRNATDLGYDENTIPDIASDVWNWVLFGSDSPLIPGSGKGKISTRLYGKSRWLARAWKTKQLRSKRHIGLDEAERLEELNSKKGKSIYCVALHT